MPMTPDAKRALATTIRGLRAHLLEALHAATESAWRLALPLAEAGLPAAERTRRARFEAWIDEQRRASGPRGRGRSAAELRAEVEKQAAYTLLNRLVILRLLEAPGPDGRRLREPAVLTGGWNSRGYKDFRSLALALVRDDPSEGYAFLLQLVFEELAQDLPGLFGAGGVGALVPVPAATLRHLVDALDDPALASCWTDDMTLGWVYQYWNDPEREGLDAKLNAGGKVEPHEIASKTQMFTERYMVDWLLQNSLNPLWMAICAKNGWTPEVVADGTLDRLEARRAAWRARREAGEVELDALMPLHGEAEAAWAYTLPQSLPEDAAAKAPDSLRALKLIDPAVGSGHFLVVALGLLFRLYQEEARHRGLVDHRDWTPAAIVERILGHNLHGLDLDPRAVQIAAAALWLKARQLAPEARPERLNLVAADLRLAGLPDDDPALTELREEVTRETGLPSELTLRVIHALRGADHLGSLLKIDRAVDEALAEHEGELGKVRVTQVPMFGAIPERQRETISRADARATLVHRIEAFLDRHTRGDDLGLRLRGEQLAAGVRFLRLLREGAYDLVVANPPYQGTAKLADAKYIEAHYPLGKADLYAAFLLRGLELAKPGGVSAMLTMRNWMFIKQYAGLRAHLLGGFDLRGLHDLSSGAFDEISAAQVVVSVVSSVFRKSGATMTSFAHRVFDDRTVTQVGETGRKRAATLCQVGVYRFDPAALKVVPEWPLVYWWDAGMLEAYRSAPLIGSVSPARFGLTTGDNDRYCRRSWEVAPGRIGETPDDHPFVPLIHGAKGDKWIDEGSNIIRWRMNGAEVKIKSEFQYGTVSRQIRNVEYYFTIGVAFSAIGSSFAARIHRRPSVFSNVGLSLFPPQPVAAVVALATRRTSSTITDLAPGIRFDVGDVNRLPLFPVPDADRIFATVEAAFTVHESHREPSVEFRGPGPSPWRHVQEWAQEAVDRPDGAPLPAYAAVLDPEPATDHLSYALGVALGRFGPAGEGVVDPRVAHLDHALPQGILFLDGSLPPDDPRDSLGHAAAAPLRAAWEAHQGALGRKRSLRDWLCHDSFKDVHKGMYENRPIHWPLSSGARTFVAWVNIHRWDARTLDHLRADHLQPALARLDGALADLRAARDGADKARARAAEGQVSRLVKARDELLAFLDAVEQCADRGAPPTDAKCPPRERDVRYLPDLDDGVMVNAAALWPLLEPQWKDPKKWWKELCEASGRKDYDWSQLAMRYWPTRVAAKCKEDPSLAVAHGCFWREHPARAWAWELRLQDEIGPDFRIAEPDADAARQKWLTKNPSLALEAVEKEAVRRMGRGDKRRIVPEMTILEEGLWSALPAQVWAMELRVAEKQGADFHLRAPDEPAERARWQEANPEAVKERADRVANLVPTALAFGEESGEDVEDEGDGEGEE